MTTPFWCLLVVMLMPFVLAGVGGYLRARQFGTLDTKYPRQQSAKGEGATARAVAAQANAWEALPIFASAVLVAHVAGADPERSATLSLLYVVARAGHAVCYLANWDIARSLVFLVGLGLSIGLFVLAAL